MDELDSLNLFVIIYISLADVAELADAIDLGSIVERRGGSTPFIRTNIKNRCRYDIGFLFLSHISCN